MFHLKLVLVIYVASFPGTILLPIACNTIEGGSWVGSEERLLSCLASTSQLRRPGIGTNVLCNGWLYESYTITGYHCHLQYKWQELWWWTGYETSLSRRCGSLFMHVHIYGMSYMCLPAPLALFSGPAQLSVTCSILTSRRALPCLSVNWHKLECTS